MLAAVLICFFSALFMQLVLFRICNFRRPFVGIAGVFLLGLLAGVFALWLKGNSWSELLYFIVTYLAWLGVYLVTYLNALEIGPSFLILGFLKKVGQSDRAGFSRVITAEGILGQRLRVMHESGLLVLANGKFQITVRGERYLWFYTFYRRFLGARERGG